jgi:hypothetical protein
MALLNALAAQNATARTTGSLSAGHRNAGARPDDITSAAVYLDEVLQSSTPEAERRCERLSRRGRTGEEPAVFQSGETAHRCRWSWRSARGGR